MRKEDIKKKKGGESLREAGRELGRGLPESSFQLSDLLHIRKSPLCLYDSDSA